MFDVTAVLSPDKVPAMLFAIPTIIGLVNATQQTFPQVKGLWGILAGVAYGLALGFTHVMGLTWELGLIAGFAGSGVYKIAQKNGGN